MQCLQHAQACPTSSERSSPDENSSSSELYAAGMTLRSTDCLADRLRCISMPSTDTLEAWASPCWGAF